MVRVGIVGCSNVGRSHAARFLKCSNAEIAAYCDLGAEPRQLMRTEVLEPAGLNPPQFNDYDEMLSEVELDAVDLILPHSLHHPLAMTALDRGKHVLVEKPMVTNSDQATELVAKCAETGLLLQISFQSVFTDAFQYMRERVRSGDVGEVLYVHGHLYQGWLANLDRKPEKKWRLNKEIGGGGELYDTGSHLINAMLWTVGLKPVRVYAEIDNRSEEVDVCSSLSFRFENGAVGNIAVSGETFMRSMVSRLIITGTKLEFSVTHSGKELQVFGPDGFEDTAPELPAGTTPQANFVDAIEGKAELLCPVERGLELAKFMDAVYASAERGAPVDVEG